MDPTQSGAGELILDPEGSQSIEPPKPGEMTRAQRIEFGELLLDDDTPVTPEDPPSDQPPAGDPGNAPVVTADEFDLLGRKFTRAQLEEIVPKGEDYTRKTQELAEKRAGLAPLEGLQNYLNSLPPQAFEELIQQAEAIEAKYTGKPFIPRVDSAEPPLAIIPPANLPKINVDELSDESKMLYEALSGQLANAGALLQRQQQTISSLQAELKGTVGELRGLAGDRAAAEAAAAIKTEFGVDVTPAQLRQYSQETGIADLEAAFMKANKANILQGAYMAGSKGAAAAKPAAPSGQGARTLSLSKNKHLSTDALFRAAREGVELVD